MTIDEAKNKWCCTHEIEKCLADECMAWRWYYEPIPDSEKSSEITAEFLLARTLGVPEMRMSKTNGYCGLAGKEGAE